MRAKIKIGAVCASCVAVMWVCGRLYQELSAWYETTATLSDLEFSWFFRLLLNLAGYATILVPGVILYKYLERTNYFDKITNSSCVSRGLTVCFGPSERLGEAAARHEGEPRDPLELLLCFTGLMAAYLVWGLLQEKIMTQSYTMADGSLVRFTDSQFLVLINRVCALLAAASHLVWTRRALLVQPAYRFSYCALTNVVSAWCQYEALKYVSFPTQVLSKSCKVIPVMLMGKLISRNKYEMYEYLTAALISFGMVMFMCGSQGDDHAWSWSSTSWSGVALLGLYMCCDSFTSSWQAALFAETRCRPLQMLVAVNMFSCLFTAHALYCRPGNHTSVALLQHGGFVWDVAVLSASSAAGQLLIYRTIASFGAVVFCIMMTLRQAVSILLSCLVYGHAVSASGAAGVVLVFSAVLLRLYCAQRLRQKRTRPT